MAARIILLTTILASIFAFVYAAAAVNTSTSKSTTDDKNNSVAETTEGSLHYENFTCPQGSVRILVNEENKKNDTRHIETHIQCFDKNGKTTADETTVKDNQYPSSKIKNCFEASIDGSFANSCEQHRSSFFDFFRRIFGGHFF